MRSNTCLIPDTSPNTDSLLPRRPDRHTDAERTVSGSAYQEKEADVKPEINSPHSLQDYHEHGRESQTNRMMPAA